MKELNLRFSSVPKSTSKYHKEVKLLTFGRGTLRKGISFMEDLFCARLGEHLTVGIWENYVL